MAKERRAQFFAREKQEQKERRAQYAAGEREQQAKIEAERIATKARKMAILAESKAKKMKSRWLRFGYLLGKKESVREMWVFSLAFHELWTSRSPSTTPPPEAIISRYVSNWWTSRKTKKFMKVSERSERALKKTSILAMIPTKWLQTVTHIHY